MKKCKSILSELKYYCFYSWYFWLKDRPLKIKSFYLRGKNGWSPEDTWNFDYYLAKVICEGLKHFKKYYHGIEPSKEVIDKIIAGFDCAILLVDEPGLNLNEKRIAEQIKNEGFDLFKRYFNYLWD